MPVIYFDRTFGGVRMFVASIETERGRDIATQSPSLGGRHVHRDRGPRDHVTRAEILFLDQPGQDPYTDRYDAFVKIAESGEVQIFSHPLDGSYRAKAGELQVRTDAASRMISVTCTFFREQPEQAVLPVAGGTNPAAGVESVAVAGAEASAALLKLGIPGDIVLEEGEEARADGIKHAQFAASADTIATWRAAGEDLDSNQVLLDVARMVAEIDSMTEELELLTDITRWQAFRDVALLRHEITRAGEAFTAASRATFDVLVGAVARPLLAICAEVYGAASARARAEEVRRSNRIRTPGLVPAGTVLKMPAEVR